MISWERIERWFGWRPEPSEPVGYPSVTVGFGEETPRRVKNQLENSRVQGVYDTNCTTIWLSVEDGDDLVDRTVDVLCHEHMHHLLYEFEGMMMTVALDNCVDGEYGQMMHQV